MLLSCAFKSHQTREDVGHFVFRYFFLPPALWLLVGLPFCLYNILDNVPQILEALSIFLNYSFCFCSSDSQSQLTYLQVHWFFFFFLFKSAVNSSFLHPEFLSGSLFLHWYFCLVRHSLEFSFSSLGLVSCSWNTFMTPDLSHCLVVRPCLGFLRDSFCWLLVFLRIGHTHLFLCMVLNFVLSTRRFKEYHKAKNLLLLFVVCLFSDIHF